MHDDRIWIRADDAGHFIANRHRHVPPAFGPGAHAARRPDVRVFMQSIVSGAWHRDQTVRDQIDSLFQDGKLRTPFEQFVGQEEISPFDSKIIYHSWAIALVLYGVR